MIIEFKEIWADMTRQQHTAFCTLLSVAVLSLTAIILFIVKANSMSIELFAVLVPVGIILVLVFTLTFYFAMRMLWNH